MTETNLISVDNDTLKREFDLFKCMSAKHTHAPELRSAYL